VDTYPLLLGVGHQVEDTRFFVERCSRAFEGALGGRALLLALSAAACGAGLLGRLTIARLGLDPCVAWGHDGPPPGANPVSGPMDISPLRRSPAAVLQRRGPSRGVGRSAGLVSERNNVDRSGVLCLIC